ncbi:MAG: hypothetical protein H8E53_06935 [Planctomycetes bacterium]|nr:hypothetical protein [Planctomycetota bacterium]
MALCGYQSGRQGCTGLEERTDETQDVTEKLADACHRVPEVPEEVDNGIHAALIADQASKCNLT